MPLTQVEFETLIEDPSKRTEGDLDWSEDEDHSPAVQFRVELQSDAGYPTFVRGRFNPLAGTLSYVLIHRGSGRIYGLDLGADHHNPSCDHVGEVHKHRWSDQFADKQAYLPAEIRSPWSDPVAVWRDSVKRPRSPTQAGSSLPRQGRWSSEHEHRLRGSPQSGPRRALLG